MGKTGTSSSGTNKRPRRQAPLRTPTVREEREPTPPSDPEKFRTLYCEKFFYKTVAPGTPIQERPVIWQPNDDPWGIGTEITRREWNVRLLNPVEHGCLNMVKEFYANALLKADDFGVLPETRVSMFRGAPISFTPESVRRYLGLLAPYEEEDMLHQRDISHHTLIQNVPHADILAAIAVPGAIWVTKEDNDGQKVPRYIPRALLTALARVWAHFLQDTVVPSSNKTEIRENLAVCIYCLIMEYPIDVARIVSWRIHQLVNIKKRTKGLRMPYPNLITGMIHQQLRLAEPAIEVAIKINPLLTVQRAQDVFHRQPRDSAEYLTRLAEGQAAAPRSRANSRSRSAPAAAAPPAEPPQEVIPQYALDLMTGMGHQLMRMDDIHNNLGMIWAAGGYDTPGFRENRPMSDLERRFIGMSFGHSV